VTTDESTRQGAAEPTGKASEATSPARTSIPAGSARPVGLATASIPATAAIAAGIGLLSGGVTLALADLVAGLTHPAASPVLAVGGTFIDLTPSWLKDLAIRRFGTHDKQVLLAGMGLTLSVLCALIGILARRSLKAGIAATAVLGAVAGAAALSRPGAGASDALPTLIGVVGGAAVLVALTRLTRPTSLTWRPADRTASGTTAERPDDVRRRTLVGFGMASGLFVVLAAASRQVRSAIARTASPGSVTLPAPSDPAVPLRRSATFDATLAERHPDGGWTPFQTPNGEFYRVDTALAVPRVPTADWRLRVHGMVQRPFELSFDQVLDEPLVERWITLSCVSNEVGGRYAGNARWLGVPLQRLLDRAGPTAGADMVLSTSVDGFTASTPLSALTDGRDALLAIGMNGAPLPAEHGFPARLVVPGLYGFVSATKWVVDLEVTRFDRATSYWTDRGWAQQAPIKTFSRIDVPRSFARVPAGRVQVGGVAWAQHRGLETVELSVDGAAWQPALLAEGAGRDTWAQWVWTWDARPGRHTLQVRATDATQQIQPDERRPPKPDGATGWHSVAVNVT
jgi:DMSO/TMAO reductase YedYZ molybdopterin-dependent catalytic subunit